MKYTRSGMGGYLPKFKKPQYFECYVACLLIIMDNRISKLVYLHLLGIPTI